MQCLSKIVQMWNWIAVELCYSIKTPVVPYRRTVQSSLGTTCSGELHGLFEGWIIPCASRNSAFTASCSLGWSRLGFAVTGRPFVIIWWTVL
ncbi:hypothetical protein JTE90_027106 [Oedothorax gibbosus]|uniref:Uncharacterized protein n=1 Tax=Oedothorax gibbosus TaxID=931172 RepID=A0AAV6TSR1_9ARAC|nr:hypothetical protein JTE90_027106 [Oedothorax gibbosus]